MAKHLLINGQAGNIRLAEETDTEELLAKLAEAAKSGEIVEVHGGDMDPRRRHVFHVNPSAASWWSIIES
ncbi:MAG TPA: hypothetical protein K8V84_09600 [Nocardiopsis listeri]|uniref:hypothetical protein n=1 Tax=Nocardiopsis listeri TaxID=53440 RepID=UPI001E17BAAD|nr:hypothetical protein [Nocardiopsis listeri]HJE58749.1 hypothetical protein [Nocardiopsis listeri]